MVMTFSHFRPGQTPAGDLCRSVGCFPEHHSVSQIDGIPAMEIKAGYTVAVSSLHEDRCRRDIALTVTTREPVFYNSFTAGITHTPHVLVTLHPAFVPPVSLRTR